jgi:5'(3')-deoxyribonucleotidase
MSKKVIAVDNDDVLFQLVDSIFDFYNTTYQTSYNLKDQQVFNLETTFRLTEKETMKRIYEFYHSKYLLATKPMPGALAALKKLKQNYDLVLITARPTFTKKVTLQALNEHFPNIFQSVFLTNAFSLTGKKKLKSEVCLEVNAKALIDDALHNAEDCAQKKIPVLLFNRPWNQSFKVKQDQTKLIHPVQNWSEVSQVLHKLQI